MTRQLTRWNPFREMTRFPWLDADEFWKEHALRPIWADFEAEPQIRVDVSEDEGAYTVKAEVPGVKKESIDVSIEGNTVAISADEIADDLSSYVAASANAGKFSVSLDAPPPPLAGASSWHLRERVDRTDFDRRIATGMQSLRDRVLGPLASRVGLS